MIDEKLTDAYAEVERRNPGEVRERAPHGPARRACGPGRRTEFRERKRHGCGR